MSSSKVNDLLVETPSEFVTKKALLECPISLLPKGAVIIGLIGQGKTRGMASILAIKACISQNIAAIVPEHTLNGCYLLLFLKGFYPIIRELGRGGNQEALNCEIVSNLRVLIPPLEEQLLIVDKVQSLIQRIEGGIERLTREIDSSTNTEPA